MQYLLLVMELKTALSTTLFVTHGVLGGENKDTSALQQLKEKAFVAYKSDLSILKLIERTTYYIK